MAQYHGEVSLSTVVGCEVGDGSALWELDLVTAMLLITESCSLESF